MASTTFMTDLQRTILRQAVQRVQTLHPTMLARSADDFLARVADLADRRDPAFGRKKSSRGAPLSATTIGIDLIGRPDIPKPYFEAVDIIHANEDGSGYYRGDGGWIHYVPGPVSNAQFVGPEQGWAAPRTYADVSWPDDGDDSPQPAPVPAPGVDIDLGRLGRRVSALEDLVGATRTIIDDYLERRRALP